MNGQLGIALASDDSMVGKIMGYQREDRNCGALRFCWAIPGVLVLWVFLVGAGLAWGQDVGSQQFQGEGAGVLPPELRGEPLAQAAGNFVQQPPLPPEEEDPMSRMMAKVLGILDAGLLASSPGSVRGQALRVCALLGYPAEVVMQLDDAQRATLFLALWQKLDLEELDI